MNALYALIVACLSLQPACIGRPETPAVSTNIVDEYNVGTVAAPAVRPIDAAEFAGTSRDDALTAWSWFDEGDDAVIVTAATPKDIALFDAGADFNFDTEHTATVPVPGPYSVDTAGDLGDDAWDL